MYTGVLAGAQRAQKHVRRKEAQRAQQHLRLTSLWWCLPGTGGGIGVTALKERHQSESGPKRRQKSFSHMSRANW